MASEFGSISLSDDNSSSDPTVKQLSKFLEHYGLQKYERPLAKEGLENFSMINALDDDDITQIAKDAIKKRLHIKMFMKAIKAVKSGEYIPPKIESQRPEEVKQDETKSEMSALDKLRESRKDLKGEVEVKYDGENKADGDESRTIIFIGQTGSGKTTLINSLCNYLNYVSYDEQFRYKLIWDEKNTKITKDTTKSQTQDITSYHLGQLSAITDKKKLTIIDTPGFGDTEGPQQDMKIRTKFTKLFNELKFIDAVYFVVKSSATRLTPAQKYIFDIILDLFGEDVKNNIFTIFTFSDGSEPGGLASVRKLGIPCDPYFKINNSGFMWPKLKTEMQAMQKMYYEMGIKQFDIIFESLYKLPSASTKDTAETLRERDNITTWLHAMGKDLEIALDQINTARETYKELKDNKEEIDANKNYQIKTKQSVKKKIKLQNNSKALYCNKCDMTCHDHCVAGYWMNYICKAFNWHGICIRCHQKCSTKTHERVNFIIEVKDEIVYKTKEEMAKKYNLANEKKVNCENIMAEIMSDIDVKEKKIREAIINMKKSVNRLKQIALNKKVLSDTEYFDILIVTEKEERKKGWQQRVDQLINMKNNKALLEKAVNKGNDLIGSLEDSDLRQWKRGFTAQNSNIVINANNNNNTNIVINNNYYLYSDLLEWKNIKFPISVFLDRFGLSKYDNALREAGLENLANMKTLDDDDINGLIQEANLSKSDGERLIKGILAVKNGEYNTLNKQQRPQQKRVYEMKEDDELNKLKEKRKDLTGYVTIECDGNDDNDDGDNNKKRTIMFIGESGSGKTTTINSICNHLYKVGYDEPFRYKVIDEKEEKYETNNIKIYNLQNLEAINYPLTIIDTPGFGNFIDSKQENEIKLKFINLFKKIKFIDAVYFVVKATDTRLSHQQKYIFDKILNLFDDNIKNNNIFILFTFSDSGKPQALNAINKLNINYNKQYFEINNAGFQLTKNNMDKICYNLAIKQFSNIFEALSTIKTQSTAQTMEKLKLKINNHDSKTTNYPGKQVTNWVLKLLVVVGLFVFMSLSLYTVLKQTNPETNISMEKTNLTRNDNNSIDSNTSFLSGNYTMNQTQMQIDDDKDASEPLIDGKKQEMNVTQNDNNSIDSNMTQWSNKQDDGQQMLFLWPQCPMSKNQTDDASPYDALNNTEMPPNDIDENNSARYAAPIKDEPDVTTGSNLSAPTMTENSSNTTSNTSQNNMEYIKEKVDEDQDGKKASNEEDNAELDSDTESQLNDKLIKYLQPDGYQSKLKRAVTKKLAENIENDSQIKQIKKDFNHLDKKKKGYLDIGDLEHLLVNEAKVKAKRILKATDDDGDNKIDDGEFKQTWQRKQLCDADIIDKVFNVYKNDDGYIESKDLQKICDADIENIKEMIQEVDDDQDGIA